MNKKCEVCWEEFLVRGPESYVNLKIFHPVAVKLYHLQWLSPVCEVCQANLNAALTRQVALIRAAVDSDLIDEDPPQDE